MEMENNFNTVGKVQPNNISINLSASENTVKMQLNSDASFSFVHNDNVKLSINKEGKFFVDGNEVDPITDGDKVYEAFKEIVFNCQLAFGFISISELSNYIYKYIEFQQIRSPQQIEEIVNRFATDVYKNFNG